MASPLVFLSLYLYISHALPPAQTQAQPTEDVIWTQLYGDDYISSHAGNYPNQGRINAINTWGFIRKGAYTNTTFIRIWGADDKNLGNDDGEFGYAGKYSDVQSPVYCAPFTLADTDYIIGYRVYDTADYIYGLTFYTLEGLSFHCSRNASSLPGITDNGVVSYYYGPGNFWYLTGFYGRAGMILDQMQFQFTRFITADPTSDPTVDPTFGPTKYPTIDPTMNPVSSGKVNIVNTVVQTLQSTQAMFEETETGKTSALNGVGIILVMVAIVSLCVCAAFVVFAWQRRKQKKVLNKTSGNMDVENCAIQTETKWNREMVQRWLEDMQLPQYYAIFVDNGYDSIRTIKAIRNKSELEDIGITIKGHQTLIIAEIEKLEDYRHAAMPETETATEHQPGAYTIGTETTIGGEVETDGTPGMKQMLSMSNSESLWKSQNGKLEYETIGASDDEQQETIGAPDDEDDL